MTNETSLVWRDAEESDRGALKEFVCATPPLPVYMRVKKHHRSTGAVWEREVQSGIRRDLKPPARAGELILIGIDDGGLGAIAWCVEVGGPDSVKILAFALAYRLRNKRCGLAEEMAEQTISRLSERAGCAGHEELVTWGFVHVKNSSCQSLLGRIGFTQVERDDTYGRWMLRVKVA